MRLPALAFVCLLALAAPVRAQELLTPPTSVELPIVVVVEASGTRFDAARIRHAIADQLGQRVASILEAGTSPTLGTLAVAVTERGRHAAINYTPVDGTRFAVMIEVNAETDVDTFGEWLVAPCVSAIRTSAERRAQSTATVEVLDPWLASHASPARSEVIDPWVGTPRRRVRVAVVDYHLGDEIIDPWAAAVDEYHDEEADRLSRPAPTPSRHRRRR